MTDGQKIREALTKTDFEGIRQRFTFTESGQAKIDMWIVKVEKKKVAIPRANPGLRKSGVAFMNRAA